MAKAAQIAESYGWDEVNINCGCPSDRASDGCFGAQLMLDPHLIGWIAQQMMESVSIPVSVKCRLGVDKQDTYDFAKEFIETVSSYGVKKFYVHAWKVYLKGLSTKQNRTVPPLWYDRVFKLKQDFPHLEIFINGGISSI